MASPFTVRVRRGSSCASLLLARARRRRQRRAGAARRRPCGGTRPCRACRDRARGGARRGRRRARARRRRRASRPAPRAAAGTRIAVGATAPSATRACVQHAARVERDRDARADHRDVHLGARDEAQIGVGRARGRPRDVEADQQLARPRARSCPGAVVNALDRHAALAARARDRAARADRASAPAPCRRPARRCRDSRRPTRGPGSASSRSGPPPRPDPGRAARSRRARRPAPRARPRRARARLRVELGCRMSSGIASRRRTRAACRARCASARSGRCRRPGRARRGSPRSSTARAIDVGAS